MSKIFCLNNCKRLSIFIILFLLIATVLFLFHSPKSIPSAKLQDYHSLYTQNCMNLFNKLRYPNQSLVIRPPLERPPDWMVQDFIQNGEMPFKGFYYYDQVYSDADSNNKSHIVPVDMSEFFKWLKKVKANEKLNYEDYVLNEVMHLFSSAFKDKTVAVIGTQDTWIEAILFDIGAKFITTVDYTRKRYPLPNMKWVHVNDYLEEAMEKNTIEEFENIVTFSSIEHSGLGRYGDPLSPYGDIEAIQQIHCMLKPEGLLVLGIPTSQDDTSFVQFNAHRIYGSQRFRLLFKGWEKIYQVPDSTKGNTIFVLRKTDLPSFEIKP